MQGLPPPPHHLVTNLDRILESLPFFIEKPNFRIFQKSSHCLITPLELADVVELFRDPSSYSVHVQGYPVLLERLDCVVYYLTELLKSGSCRKANVHIFQNRGFVRLCVLGKVNADSFDWGNFQSRQPDLFRRLLSRSPSPLKSRSRTAGTPARRPTRGSAAVGSTRPPPRSLFSKIRKDFKRLLGRFERLNLKVVDVNTDFQDSEMLNGEGESDSRVHCLCRGFRTDGMIPCSRCDDGELYHPSCLGISESDLAPKRFSCHRCLTVTEKLYYNLSPASFLLQMPEESKVEDDSAAEKDCCQVCSRASGQLPPYSCFWLDCDECDKWFHNICVSLAHIPEANGGDLAFYCRKCLAKKTENGAWFGRPAIADQELMDVEAEEEEEGEEETVKPERVENDDDEEATEDVDQQQQRMDVDEVADQEEVDVHVDGEAAAPEQQPMDLDEEESNGLKVRVRVGLGEGESDVEADVDPPSVVATLVTHETLTEDDQEDSETSERPPSPSADPLGELTSSRPEFFGREAVEPKNELAVPPSPERPRRRRKKKRLRGYGSRSETPGTRRSSRAASGRKKKRSQTRGKKRSQTRRKKRTKKTRRHSRRTNPVGDSSDSMEETSLVCGTCHEVTFLDRDLADRFKEYQCLDCIRHARADGKRLSVKYTTVVSACPGCGLDSEQKFGKIGIERDSIGCDDCDEWWHQDCAHLPLSDRLPDSWSCPVCVGETQCCGCWLFYAGFHCPNCDPSDDDSEEDVDMHIDESSKSNENKESEEPEDEIVAPPETHSEFGKSLPDIGDRTTEQLSEREETENLSQGGKVDRPPEVALFPSEVIGTPRSPPFPPEPEPGPETDHQDSEPEPEIPRDILPLLDQAVQQMLPYTTSPSLNPWKESPLNTTLSRQSVLNGQIQIRPGFDSGTDSGDVEMEEEGESHRRGVPPEESEMHPMSVQHRATVEKLVGEALRGSHSRSRSQPADDYFCADCERKKSPGQLSAPDDVRPHTVRCSNCGEETSYAHLAYVIPAMSVRSTCEYFDRRVTQFSCTSCHEKGHEMQFADGVRVCPKCKLDADCSIHSQDPSVECVDCRQSYHLSCMDRPFRKSSPFAPIDSPPDLDVMRCPICEARSNEKCRLCEGCVWTRPNRTDLEEEEIEIEGETVICCPQCDQGIFHAVCAKKDVQFSPPVTLVDGKEKLYMETLCGECRDFSDRTAPVLLSSGDPSTTVRDLLNIPPPSSVSVSKDDIEYTCRCCGKTKLASESWIRTDDVTYHQKMLETGLWSCSSCILRWNARAPVLSPSRAEPCPCAFCGYDVEIEAVYEGRMAFSGKERTCSFCQRVFHGSCFDCGSPASSDLCCICRRTRCQSCSNSKMWACDKSNGGYLRCSACSEIKHAVCHGVCPTTGKERGPNQFFCKECSGNWKNEDRLNLDYALTALSFRVNEQSDLPMQWEVPCRKAYISQLRRYSDDSRIDCIVVSGQSGCGKSVVVRKSMLLREFDKSGSFPVKEGRPSDSPYVYSESFARADFLDVLLASIRNVALVLARIKCVAEEDIHDILEPVSVEDAIRLLRPSLQKVSGYFTNPSGVAAKTMTILLHHVEVALEDETLFKGFVGLFRGTIVRLVLIETVLSSESSAVEVLREFDPVELKLPLYTNDEVAEVLKHILEPACISSLLIQKGVDYVKQVALYFSLQDSLDLLREVCREIRRNLSCDIGTVIACIRSSPGPGITAEVLQTRGADDVMRALLGLVSRVPIFPPHHYGSEDILRYLQKKRAVPDFEGDIAMKGDETETEGEEEDKDLTIQEIEEILVLLKARNLIGDFNSPQTSCFPGIRVEEIRFTEADIEAPIEMI